ncbi:MAG TPA: N,N-dimethylformamidase beta subunit family domain-containing protein [Candidatus Nitrosopolaris sp.]|nr:N,N-dimethylformamidase beta subunit family domain-containing protein [Candidatus Nitrosopolaris sp.]
MRKSVLNIIIIVSIITITIVTVLSNKSWLLLTNNDPSKFTIESKVLSIALIKPTFTAAAYHSSFYKFYFVHSTIPLHARKNITSDLNLLSSPVSNLLTGSSSAYMIDYLTAHMRTSLPKSNTHVLTDEDVDKGRIFLGNGNNKYDVLVLGHQEYVTQQEYDNLKQFVSNGGTMILMDGNVFYAEVKYDRNTHTITLLKGHGWAFNGKSAWKSVRERWANETSQWVGSNFYCFSCNVTFGNNPFNYRHHEEQYITNPNDLILLDYKAMIPKKQLITADPVIATYELNYQKGKVISLSIYSDDIIANSKFKKFLSTLLKHVEMTAVIY